MRSILILILFLGAINNLSGQDCLEDVKVYYSSIDTTQRPVYRITEELPEIVKSGTLMKILAGEPELIDSLKCCPIKVWCCFVVEPDSSLTNIRVCTKMMFCDKQIIESETKRFNERLIKQLAKTKSKPGNNRGKNVAIACTIPIHFECFDWK